MTMLDAAGNIKPLHERLRQAAQEGREIIEPWQFDPNLYDEAAAEIERLRAALKIIEDKNNCRPDRPDLTREFQRIAKEALSLSPSGNM